MATAISTLPERQLKPLVSAYLAGARARRLRTVGIILITIVLLFLSANAADIRPATFFAKIGNFGNYILRITPHITIENFFGDIRDWYWDFRKWTVLLLQTLLIAYLGTLLGFLGAFCLCFIASANLTQHSAARFVARRFLEFCRTVPDIVFALIFVIAFGLGPMAGVLALAIHTMGALGKLFAEVIENIDMKPVDGIRATGGNWLEIVRFAALPQVLPGFASYALLRFEINVRGAGVMGFVGAGGIGQEFLVAIRSFYYSDVSAILVMIAITVIAIDMLTERLRHRLVSVEKLQ
ncbi:MAG: phosphonate ABC transporter, permease protein PhnE [Bauldia sp.]